MVRVHFGPPLLELGIRNEELEISSESFGWAEISHI